MSKASNKKPVKQAKKPALENLYWPFTQKKTFLLTSGLIALIGIVVFWRYISGQFLYIFEDVGSDTVTLFYPNLVHLAKYYQEVGIPGWSFYVGLGEGIYPAGLLSPLDWVYYLMDARTIARSIGMVQLLKVIGSGIVFALFLKKIGLEKPVMLIGAILYAFGGYLIVGSSWYIHSTHIFWITVAILGFEMLLRDQKWWLFPIPFIFLVGTRGYFLIIFMTLYAAVRTLDYYQMDWRKLLKVYGRMLICGVLALLLTAPFVGAKVSKLKNSPRITGNVSKMEKLSELPVFQLAEGKHNATAILRWFSNDVIGFPNEYKGFRNYLEGPLFYIGLLALLLLPQFFFIADKRQKWLYGGLLFFWLWLIVFPWFRYAFYAFAGNYYKGALSLFIPFSLLFVALLAFDKIIKGKEVNLIVLAVTILLCLIGIWYPYSALPEGIRPDIQMLVSFFLLLEGIVLAGFNIKSTRKIVLPVMVILVTLEAGIFSYISNNKRDAIPAADLQKPLRHFDETNEALDFIEQQANDLFYRTDKVYGSVKSGYNDALVQGFFGTKMYQSHTNKFYVQFLEDMGIIPQSNEASSRWVVGVSKRTLLHPLMATKYLLAKAETRGDVNKDMYSLIETKGPVEIYKNNYYIPFGIPFDKYFSESDFLLLDNSQKMEAIYHGIVLSEAPGSQMKEIPKGNPDTISFGNNYATTWRDLNAKAMEMTYFSQSNIRGKIALQKPSVIFFSLPYNEAWHVYVDGLEQELMLVDFGFSGVMASAGAHTIELKYVPLMSRLGWWFFIPGLAVYLFLAIRNVRLLPI